MPAPLDSSGRHFATFTPTFDCRSGSTDWSDHHILVAMSRRGEDLPGNLLVGDESFARWQALEMAGTTRDDYPALAAATMAGHPPGRLPAANGRNSACSLMDGTCW